MGDSVIAIHPLFDFKNINMTQFELKLHRVIYKVKTGSGLTISNQKMTDELAIEFLKVKPSRLELFSKYPDNILELISGEISTDETEITFDTASKPSIPPIVIPEESSKKSCTSCKDKKISNSKKATPRKRTTRKSSGKTTK